MLYNSHCKMQIAVLLSPEVLQAELVAVKYNTLKVFSAHLIRF